MSKSSILQEDHPFPKAPNLGCIGKQDKSGKLCKYKNMKDAEQWIREGKITFVEPSAWNDPYEKLFYEADLKRELGINFSQKVLAFCVTRQLSSEPAWVVYKYGKSCTTKDGLVVQMVINQQKFREKLSEYVDKHPGVKLHEGCVDYKCTSTITRIRTVTDVLHKPYFHPAEDFNLVRFLSLLLIKRKAYDYEKEIRYFLTFDDESMCKKDKDGHLYYDLDIPLSDCITKVVIDHEAQKNKAADITTFKQICNEKGIKYSIHNLYNGVRDNNIFIKPINNNN